MGIIDNIVGRDNIVGFVWIKLRKIKIIFFSFLEVF